MIYIDIMGTCCTSDKEEAIVENPYITKPITYVEDVDLLKDDNSNKTIPPCRLGNYCPCACHRGGKCDFKK